MQKIDYYGISDSSCYIYKATTTLRLSKHYGRGGRKIFKMPRTEHTCLPHMTEENMVGTPTYSMLSGIDFSSLSSLSYLSFWDVFLP